MLVGSDSTAASVTGWLEAFMLVFPCVVEKWRTLTLVPRQVGSLALQA